MRLTFNGGIVMKHIFGFVVLVITITISGFGCASKTPLSIITTEKEKSPTNGWNTGEESLLLNE